MEHPLFALRAGDTQVRTYKRNGMVVTVKPGPDGCATIYDKDLWIYCISQMVEAKNRGREITRTVRFTAYDFLSSTNRDVSGRAYLRMAEMFARLKGTTIETNIETAGKRERTGFGLIDTWRIVERDRDSRMVSVEVALPDWLYRSVDAFQVLTLSRDYFRIRKPLARRIYELARKHCGSQPRWTVSVAVLHEKSGSTSSAREFRRLLKTISESSELPDYRVIFDGKRDVVVFHNGPKAFIEQIQATLAKSRRPDARRLTRPPMA